MASPSAQVRSTRSSPNSDQPAQGRFRRLTPRSGGVLAPPGHGSLVVSPDWRARCPISFMPILLSPRPISPAWRPLSVGPDSVVRANGETRHEGSTAPSPEFWVASVRGQVEPDEVSELEPPGGVIPRRGRHQDDHHHEEPQEPQGRLRKETAPAEAPRPRNRVGELEAELRFWRIRSGGDVDSGFFRRGDPGAKQR
jgi:hypothetical protein